MRERAFACMLVASGLAMSGLIWAGEAPPPPTQGEAASLPGGLGDACRSRSGCQPGLTCRGDVCVDEREGESCEVVSDCGGRLACVANVCVPPVAARCPGDRLQAWGRFRLSWVHPFVGTTLVAGPVTMRGAGIHLQRVGSLWALRAGAFVGRGELAVEISPMSYFPIPGMGPSVQANASYAYMLPVREGRTVSLDWPLRVGVGAFGYDSLGLVFLQLRADLLGAVLRIGHVLVEAHAPSFRYAGSIVNGERLHLWTLHFGGGVTYAF